VIFIYKEYFGLLRDTCNCFHLAVPLGLFSNFLLGCASLLTLEALEIQIFQCVTRLLSPVPFEFGKARCFIGSKSLNFSL
jgi:hypothetical protein